MSIPRFAIERPVMMTMISSIIILIGGISLSRLPVDLLPDISQPTVNVRVSYTGVGPLEMEELVVRPLEQQLSAVSGLDQMNSNAQEGSASIQLNFTWGTDLNEALDDIRTRIDRVRGRLPEDADPPIIQKFDSNAAPIMGLALESTDGTLDRVQLRELAENILSPRFERVQGVAAVSVNGGLRRQIHVDLSREKITALDLSVDRVVSVLRNENQNIPIGEVYQGDRALLLRSQGQYQNLEQIASTVVLTKNGVPVYLKDIADVSDSTEDVRSVLRINGRPGVRLSVTKQSGTNTVQIAQGVRAEIERINREVPGVRISMLDDSAKFIERSISAVQEHVMLGSVLVILIIFLFLRNVTATMIPAMALPVALIGTFAGMYLMGFSVDNLSLLAITLSVGFVVDDAIVMLENIVRHLEAGETPLQAALRGSREIAFTIVSITLSLVAVFIPVLFLGGVVGRLFREFAVTISMTILISSLVSLTLTPMLCSRILRGGLTHSTNPVLMWSEAAFEWMRRIYESTLDRALKHPRVVLGVTFGCLVLSALLYVVIPKGFFPSEDTGFIVASVEANDDVSYEAMLKLQQQALDICARDPDIDMIVSTVGSNGPNSGANLGRLFMGMKPLSERDSTVDEIIGRLRPKLAQIAGLRVFMRPVSNISVGGRPSNSLYQYTIQGTDFDELQRISLAMEARLKQIPGLLDLSSDLKVKRPQAVFDIDTDRAAALGVSADRIRDTLYTGYGTRQISTIYTANNTYQVIMELDPAYQKDTSSLSSVYLRSDRGDLVPLSAVTHLRTRASPLTINHQAQMPAVTLSFNLAVGTSLGEVVDKINAIEQDMNLPGSITTGFQGNAQVFQDSLKGQGLLLLAAVFVIYVVLGILYESFIHPITILSGLPCAGLGALLTLLLFRMDLSVISMIGVVMLIGIVKKNAIMMLDFALERQRADANIAPEQAIREACLLRFRPIMMTTFAGIFGLLPIALGGGAGAELRRPLGVAVVGGLIFSQMLTLYITPVIYIYMERLRRRFGGKGGVPVKVAEIRPFVHAGE